MDERIPRSRKNTVLDDIAAIIGLRPTLILCAWWGGKNIVVPAVRPERSLLGRVIGETAVKRLFEAYPGEQIFVPRLTWVSEIGHARQIYNLRKTGFDDDEIARLMVISIRRVKRLGEMGQVVEDLMALEEVSRPATDISDDSARRIDRILYGGPARSVKPVKPEKIAAGKTAKNRTK